MKLSDFMYNHPYLVFGKDLFPEGEKMIFDRYLKMRP